MPADDVVPDEEREVELVVDEQDPGAQNPSVGETADDDEWEPASVVPEPDRPA